MDSLKYLFGPLEKSYYCNFFLVISIFMFVFFIGTVCMVLYSFTQRRGTIFFINSLIAMCLYFLLYFQSRLMYSVCLGSLDDDEEKKIQNI